MLFTQFQDPAIKQMAEQIANDPSFQGLTSQLQESMSGMLGGAPPGGEAPSLPVPDPANFDPTKYMQAMSGMFQNPQFMQMAEKLGQAIIQVWAAGHLTLQRHGRASHCAFLHKKQPSQPPLHACDQGNNVNFRVTSVASQFAQHLPTRVSKMNYCGHSSTDFGVVMPSKNSIDEHFLLLLSSTAPWLGLLLQSDPNMQRMMSTMQDPEYKTKVESALKGLKDDPEMGDILSELESGGPAAMMK
jgi:hypothetical protein